MRRVVDVLVFGVLYAPLLCQSTEPQRLPLQAEIRLPSITSRWKRAEDPEGPEITLDEIERCIGQDVDMRWRVNEVRHSQRQLESERPGIDKATAELKPAASAIEATQVALQEQTTRFHAQTQVLAQNLSNIEAKKRSLPRSQKEVDAINALVKAYNTDIARLNSWRIALLGQQLALNKTIETHNAKVGEVNQQAAAFNQRNNEFQKMAESPRDLWRLQPLRRWSHEQVEQVLT